MCVFFVVFLFFSLLQETIFGICRLWMINLLGEKTTTKCLKQGMRRREKIYNIYVLYRTCRRRRNSAQRTRNKNASSNNTKLIFVITRVDTLDSRRRRRFFFFLLLCYFNFTYFYKFSRYQRGEQEKKLKKNKTARQRTHICTHLLHDVDICIR